MLKYPLILIHGTGAKDNTLFWGRIPKLLKELGINVFYGYTDAWGSIEDNAKLLQLRIEDLIHKTGAEKINLIAHSKGGIDARFLISTLQYGQKIASLTTISTPHHGTLIADYFLNNRTFQSSLAKRILPVLVKIFGDNNPNIYNVINELSINYMESFNQNNLNDPLVYYNSYASAMASKKDDFLYSWTYQYLMKNAGENDGLVPVKSAVWGDKFQLFTDSSRGISHGEITDIKRRKIGAFDIPEIYRKITDDLSKNGF